MLENRRDKKCTRESCFFDVDGVSPFFFFVRLRVDGEKRLGITQGSKGPFDETFEFRVLLDRFEIHFDVFVITTESSSDVGIAGLPREILFLFRCFCFVLFSLWFGERRVFCFVAFPRVQTFPRA